MFATTLPPLPPPASSLLPTVSHSAVELHNQTHLHHLQPRRKHVNRPNGSLTLLSNDERLVVSRKLAIAMYGYSWLKPAGCTKTMLGRKEEELEREEVERQLREVELQERMAIEQEEQERREELQRQAEGGEVEGGDERDLDDEVPEAEEGEDDGGEDSVDAGNVSEEDDGDEEEDMDGDLDDDVPEADGQESSWVYDTRREPDTDSDEEGRDVDLHGQDRHFNNRLPAHRQLVEREDHTTTEAMINAMLDEDELGEYEHHHDLDDELPDMDADMGMDMDMDADLSDEVPDANDSPGWEHTDSELEESQMDISLLPPHPSSASRNPGTTHEEIRRVSGNRMLPPSLPSANSQSRDSHSQRQEQQNPRTAPRRNLRAMMATPGTADDISALISTGGTSTIASGAQVPAQTSIEPRSPPRSNWLNPAGARRTLFSGFRGGVTGSANTAETATRDASSREAQAQFRSIAGLARATVTGISSGGLFTPSPRQQQQPQQQQPPPPPQQQQRQRQQHDTPDANEEDEQSDVEEPRSRTRSGRLLGGIQAGIDRRRRPRGRAGGQT